MNSPDQRFNTNERHILVLCGSGHFLSHFFMLLFPSLALFIHRDLGLPLAEVLNLGFLMYLLFGLMAFPIGWLGDRVSSRRLLLTMFFGIGLCCLSAGFSPGAAWLKWSLAGIGLFAAIYHPVGMSLISHTCRNRGAAMGNNGMWGNLGIGIAPLLAGLTGFLIGWRNAFLLFGVVILIFSCWMTWMRIDESEVETAGQQSGRAGAGDRLLAFFLILGCITLLGLVYRGTVVSMPAWFKDNILFLNSLFELEGQIGSKSAGATLLVSFVYLFGILGQWAGGRAADRFDLLKAYFAFHCLSLPFMLGMAWLTNLPLLLSAMIYIFFALGMQPIENSLIAQLTPPRVRSRAYGLKFVVVFGVGSLSVKGVRWLMAAGHPEKIYLIQSALIACVIGLILVLLRVMKTSLSPALRN